MRGGSSFGCTCCEVPLCTSIRPRKGGLGRFSCVSAAFGFSSDRLDYSPGFLPVLQSRSRFLRPFSASVFRPNFFCMPYGSMSFCPILPPELPSALSSLPYPSLRFSGDSCTTSSVSGFLEDSFKSSFRPFVASFLLFLGFFCLSPRRLGLSEKRGSGLG